MTGHVRACIGCRGEGWVDTGLVDDWPTIAPCPECRPVTAAVHAAGGYKPDAPRIDDSERLTAIADHARTHDEPRTALWPPAQMAEAPPGHRLTNPYPKTQPRKAEHP